MVERSNKIASMLGPPAVVVLTTWSLYSLPVEVLGLLSAWILTSIPIGVLVGHCALGEE